MVWGTYIHGIFDNNSFRRAFINFLRSKKGLTISSCVNQDRISYQEEKDREYDKLACLMKEIITAYFLDLIIGDPYWLPHPVRMIGKFIEYLERTLRKNNQNQQTEKIKGIILAGITVGLSYYIIYFLIHTAGVISPGLKFAFSSFFICTALSTKNLGEEAFSVYRALKENNLVLARERVSRIVGRDTKDLGEEEIVRATIESIAEGTGLLWLWLIKQLIPLILWWDIKTKSIFTLVGFPPNWTTWLIIFLPVLVFF